MTKKINGSVELYSKIHNKRRILINLIGLSSIIAMELVALLDYSISINTDIKIVILSVMIEAYGFSSAAVWLSFMLYNLKERYSARLSSIEHIGTNLVYSRVDQSTGIEFDKTTVYRVQKVNNISETEKFYEIDGEIYVTEIMKQDYKNLNNIDTVKIPKYFDGLDDIINSIKNQ